LLAQLRPSRARPAGEETPRPLRFSDDHPRAACRRVVRGRGARALPGSRVWRRSPPLGPLAPRHEALAHRAPARPPRRLGGGARPSVAAPRASRGPPAGARRPRPRRRAARVGERRAPALRGELGGLLARGTVPEQRGPRARRAELGALPLDGAGVSPRLARAPDGRGAPAGDG